MDFLNKTSKNRSKTESVKTSIKFYLAIRNSLGTKFQLKLTILNFCAKLTQKGDFRSKTEKMKTTIEFYIFE